MFTTVLLYFMLVNGVPVSQTYERVEPDMLNCQLDVAGINGFNRVGESLDTPVIYIAACEQRKK